jgi:15-cis-phytoene synthase
MAIDYRITNLGRKSCGQPDTATHQDYLFCRQIMRSASKNYSFASKFLPKEKLHHVEALYAFLRVGDDRVDVAHTGFSSALEAIEDWERTYWSAFRTCSSSDPVLRAYLNTSNECLIPPELMQAYFKAMKADLTINRFPTFADLLDYTEGSAMIVGRAMTYIMGIRPGLTYSQVLPYADALSVAMQLSNFWRDIAYDLSIGRIYIPQEDMRRFGVSEDDLAAQRVTPQFIELMEFEIQRTESYYDQALLGIPMLAAGNWGVMCALEIYRAILSSIRRQGYDVFSRRAGAGTNQKLALVASARWNTRNL